MEDDNIFDEDDALDFIIYDELSQKENNNKGCLSVFVVLILPIGSIGLWLFSHLTS